MSSLDEHDPAPTRLEELCADRVLWGLDDAQEREFEGFGIASRRELEEMERAGAAIALAFLRDETDQPPAALTERLRQAADGFRRGAVPAAPLPFPATARDAERAAGWVQWSGWLAAAAALIVAAILWMDRRGPAAVIPLDRQLQAFLTEHPDAQVRAWESGAKGDVIWSPRAQSGFLVLRQLPANEAQAFQYQLWIFDRDRPAETPVDGGVFDVRESREAVVPIVAKLPVHDAFAFAITKERPGGVVVSDKRPEQIVAALGLR